MFKLTKAAIIISSALLCSAIFNFPSNMSKVSARADGYYYQGHYTANVSDYLTIRAEPNVNSQAKGYYYPGNTFTVLSVHNNYMGKVQYTDSSGVTRFGYVNLNYALEKYESDTGTINRVPSRYNSVTLRSEANTYSSALGYLYPGDLVSVWNVRNRIMCEKIVNGRSGWVNLDYTEFYSVQSY